VAQVKQVAKLLVVPQELYLFLERLPMQLVEVADLVITAELLVLVDQAAEAEVLVLQAVQEPQGKVMPEEQVPVVVKTAQGAEVLVVLVELVLAG
jgi:hypothetical protein